MKLMFWRESVFPGSQSLLHFEFCLDVSNSKALTQTLYASGYLIFFVYTVYRIFFSMQNTIFILLIIFTLSACSL